MIDKAEDLKMYCVAKWVKSQGGKQATIDSLDFWSLSNKQRFDLKQLIEKAVKKYPLKHNSKK